MKTLTVPEEYRNEFLLADAAFRYQLVFDPLSRRLTRLNKPLDSEKVTDYAGKMLPSETAYQLALGNLNPFTLQKVDDFNPDAIQQVDSYLLSVCRCYICVGLKRKLYFGWVIQT
jgi:exonuclease-1